MKIYLDNIIFSHQKVGGISTYFYELEKRIISNDLDAYFIEEPGVEQNLLRERLGLTNNVIKRKFCLPPVLSRHLPLRVGKPCGALFHSSYYRSCFQNGIAQITTVYDFNYERFRKGLPGLLHMLQKRIAIRNSDGVICISENTKKDLLHLTGAEDSWRIKVIYLAAGEDFYKCNGIAESKILHEASSYKPYILFVGSRGNHNNFKVVIETFERLLGYKLVIVGGKPLSTVELTRLESALPGRYVHFRGIDNTVLNGLYNMAFCLLYPSRYEGFGIPVLEAMQAGCPVITTNQSSLPEVCGDAGLVVQEITADAIRSEIKNLENELFREEIIQRGFKQAKKFSWDRTFKETVQFYEQVFNAKFGRKDGYKNDSVFKGECG